MPRKPVIAVTGTLREASVLKRLGVAAIAGGSDPERLARELRAVSARCEGIISFGMGGAIAPGLKLGDWVIGTRLTGAFPATCDARWAKALRARLPEARLGAVHADGRLFAKSADKLAQNAASGALLVDMESHVAAPVAQQAGVPFAVLRCVSDVAEADLPPAVDLAMQAGGSLDLGAVLGSILRRPGQVPALARTVSGFARAFQELGKGARAAGERLAFDER